MKNQRIIWAAISTLLLIALVASLLPILTLGADINTSSTQIFGYYAYIALLILLTFFSLFQANRYDVAIKQPVAPQTGNPRRSKSTWPIVIIIGLIVAIIGLIIWNY